MFLSWIFDNFLLTFKTRATDCSPSPIMSKFLRFSARRQYHFAAGGDGDVPLKGVVVKLELHLKNFLNFKFIS